MSKTSSVVLRNLQFTSCIGAIEGKMIICIIILFMNITYIMFSTWKDYMRTSYGHVMNECFVGHNSVKATLGWVKEMNSSMNQAPGA